MPNICKKELCLKLYSTLQIGMRLIDSAHWLIRLRLACLTSETANKWSHKKGKPAWWKKEKKNCGHTAPTERFRERQNHTTTSPTEAKSIQTSEPEDAAFNQLHVLHKERPQSSVRAGEIWFHHGKKYFRKHKFVLNYKQKSVIVCGVIC